MRKGREIHDFAASRRTTSGKEGLNVSRYKRDLF
jgi:hypothetical protein